MYPFKFCEIRISQVLPHKEQFDTLVYKVFNSDPWVPGSNLRHCVTVSDVGAGAVYDKNLWVRFNQGNAWLYMLA